MTTGHNYKKSVPSQGEPRDAAVNFDRPTYNKSIMEHLRHRPRAFAFMYTEHGNRVNADASGAKASTKHHESRLEVIQCHAFWPLKSRRGTVQ